MYTPLDRSCQYRDWWVRRRPRSRHEKRCHALHTTEEAIAIPLPVFPPALDFDATQFALPPAYDEIDLEKAVHPTKLNVRRFTKTSISFQDSWNDKPCSLADKIERIPLQTQTRRYTRFLRWCRYTALTVYRRLFTFVFIVNLIGPIILGRQKWTMRDKALSTTLAACASSNFLLAILVRQDYLVNVLFRTAWLVPWSAPLVFRHFAARVYCYGGLHSGASMAGTMWWIAFTAVASWTCLEEVTSFVLVSAAWVILLLLLAILVLSLSVVRAKFHNTFEITHRFLGWLSVLLFWLQLLLLAHSQQCLDMSLLHNVTFWNLTLMTLLLIYPWLRLRRWTFTAHVLSSHAIRLSFSHPIHRFSCLSISTSPLCEWHPFATFPDPTGQGASMVISNAGDWTHNMISTTQRQSAMSQHAARVTGRSTRTAAQVTMSFFIKSHPKAGVLSLSLLFPRIIILTTGSGIGPALSSLLERPPNQHARLIWSTRSPLKTYGPDIMALVHKADRDAIVLDTDEMGRPDLLDVVRRVAGRESVDAVFVLSNERVVRWVVGGVEQSGGRAYGPIWDS
ncbi:hypothetical protein ACEQ8H_004999 [Pleosporales sp. CAS-2024a]